MPTEKKFDPHKGFYGWDNTDGDVEFLKVDADPFDKVTPDDTYHARRFNDDAGTRNYAGHGVDGADDNEAFLDRSTDRTHEADAEIHEDMYRLIDGQVDQPAGKLLGGGGPVSRNVRRAARDGQWDGSGRIGPRVAPKTGPIGNQRKPR